MADRTLHYESELYNKADTEITLYIKYNQLYH